MNSEYIRLCSIPTVQEKIREGMGNRKMGDRVFDERGSTGIITSYYSEESFGVTFDDGSHCGYSGTPLAGPDLIRLPQAIDLHNRSRGLEGMIDRFYLDLQESMPFKWSAIVYKSKDDIDGMRFNGQTPELALLRALMAQWGIEEATLAKEKRVDAVSYSNPVREVR